MTTTNFVGLSKTQRGRAEKIRRGYLGMAHEMENKRVVDADCDQPQTLEDALRLIAHLKNKLAEAEDQREADRAAAYGDAPAVASGTVKYWDSKRVAKESSVAICTICRNAADLGGTKLGGDWLFPAGTTYGHKRKRKSK